MNHPHDFSDSEEAGYYFFTEDAQLELLQIRDRLTMYADMIFVPANAADDRPLPLPARDMQTCFRALAGEMTRLLAAGQWHPV